MAYSRFRLFVTILSMFYIFILIRTEFFIYIFGRGPDLYAYLLLIPIAIIAVYNWNEEVFKHKGERLKRLERVTYSTFYGSDLMFSIFLFATSAFFFILGAVFAREEIMNEAMLLGIVLLFLFGFVWFLLGLYLFIRHRRKSRKP